MQFLTVTWPDGSQVRITFTIQTHEDVQEIVAEVLNLIKNA
jgi:VCBS repeat-containing protein